MLRTLQARSDVATSCLADINLRWHYNHRHSYMNMHLSLYTYIYLHNTLHIPICAI